MDKGARDEQYNEQGKLAKKIKNFIYHPGDLIGSGFSSQVFKGVNQLQSDPAKKSIAIKVIELAKIQNQVENYLLNNEVNALKQLKHPNILQTVDILMTKNNVYIITEFCEGGDLLKYIKTNGPFPQTRALSLIKDIVQGYKCIEQHHIIHRDLKTSNIFLAKGRAKIADFGFCEFVGERKPQIAYNVGSPAYMSPESYKQNHYSHKSDIWAIGIILYEMLIGQTPDRSLTYTQMANNLMSGKIKNIQNDQIRRILAMCFKKNLNERIDAISLCELISMELYRQQGSMGEIQAPFNSEQNIPNRASILPPPRAVSPAHKQQTKDPRYFKSEIPSTNKIPNQSVTAGNRLPQNIIQQKNGDQFQGRRSLARQSLPVNQIKPHTQYLLFLYRLLKFVVELKLEKIYEILLPLFRHRNLIQSLAQQQVQQAGFESQQSYKEFQYLKNRFDEVYLQHTKENSTLNKRSPRKQKLDQFANVSFLHPQSLQLYRAILREACTECLNILQGKSQLKYLASNRNQVGIVLDYIMIEHELLGLHMQNIGLPDIISLSKLESIIKEQPKKLTPGHVELFKIKYNTFIANINDNIPQSLPITQNIPTIPTPLTTNAQQSKQFPPTLVNGVQSNQMLGVLMGFGQPHPPVNQIYPPNTKIQNPGIQNNNVFVSAPQPNLASIQQNIGQYNAIISQIPVHQSIVMPR